MTEPRVLTLDDCLQVARQHFGRRDVQVSHWNETRLAGERPAGFLGDHKLAQVHASADGRTDVIDVFIKTMPKNEKQAKLIEQTGAFRKEVIFYSKLVSDWEKRGIVPKKSVAERQSGDDTDDGSWSCRCYIARDDMVVLENIASSGYRSDDPRSTYDYEHVLLAIKTLAQFHAASLIYEEERSAELKKQYRIGEEYPEFLVDTFYTIKEGHPGDKTTEAGVMGLVECAKLLPVCQADDSMKRRVEEVFPGVLRHIYKAVKSSPRFRNVLCHSDLFQSNLLYRRHADGRPQDVVLVDFQLLRYAPPAHDVFDLLHLTTRRSLRQSHESQLLDEYYAALREALGRRGLDVERVLPRADFDASLDEQKFAGRLNGCFALHFIISDEKTLGPVFSNPEAYAFAVNEGQGRARLVCSQFNNDEVYRERIEECLMELLENHVLA